MKSLPRNFFVLYSLTAILLLQIKANNNSENNSGLAFDNISEDDTISEKDTYFKTVDLVQKRFQESVSKLNDFPAEDSGKTRLEHMISALVSLPKEEHDRHNLREVLRMNKADLEAEIERIWAIRQEEIREAYSNIPNKVKVLDDFIATLNEDSIEKEHLIVEALLELEYHLSDIDNAHDFHTLGGWQVLNSLIMPTHPISVREHASWVIGTSLKNVMEFNMWALRFPDSELSTTNAILSENTNTIDKLIACLEETPTEHHWKMYVKVIYALSSILRHNIEGQEYFIEANGMETLKKVIYQAINANSTDDPKTIHKTIVKTLVLITDLFTDENLKNLSQFVEKDTFNFGMISQQIVKTDGFCKVLLQAWEYFSYTGVSGQLLEKMLESTQYLIKVCNNPAENRTMAGFISTVLSKIRSNEKYNEYDNAELAHQIIRTLNLVNPTTVPIRGEIHGEL